MRCRSAVGGDQRQYLLEVEQGSVGWCEVAGDEHEWMPRVRHAGSIETPQVREHALGDVVEIGGALAEVAADRLQRGAEACEGVVHAPFGSATVVDAGIDLILKRRVLGDHRLRFEHFFCGPSGRVSALLQLGGDRGYGLTSTIAFRVGADRAGRVLRCRKRFSHANDGALGDAAANTYTAQLGHPADS